MTATATGASRSADTASAVSEAVGLARRKLGVAPALGFLFCSPRHDLGKALERAKAEAGCEIIGAHTAGEFTEAGAMRGGVVVLLVASESLVFEAAAAAGVRADPAAVARALGAKFASLAARAAPKGLGLSTTVLLVDALGGNGERVVKELLGNTRLFQQVVGGAAGDDGQFKATAVGGPGSVGRDVAACVHVFDSKPWGVGVDHGLTPQTKTMTVTKAKGSVLQEIDRKPAFEVYREYAASKGIELTPTTASQYLIGNELGVMFLEQLHHARAAVGVGPAGELQLVSDIELGARVCILDGQPEAMVAACKRAAEQAKTNLGGGKAAGVLVFDCICRGMILGREFQREIDAVKSVFPDTPIAGFLTYGEIARFRGKLDGWHNATAVVVAIAA
jgi:methyl-accepting chemotaxis protein